ncbi:MAG: alpha/beta hydrolase [Rhizobiales bacterium]|nr:alpha/beta hydrolase [Hyphomicrobiales bacterium]
MEETQGADIWREFSCRTMDDLTIRGRDYGNRLSDTMPLVCLPGLTRSTRDFDALATLISQDSDAPRRVLTLDYRGRGRSDYDPNWENYHPLTEAQDVLNAITAAGLRDVAILGTSRGGIIAMLLGALRPGILKGVILHDIGPTIDVTGLIKIKNYVSQMPQPRNWQDAADIMRTVHRGSFPNNNDEDWMQAARLTFADKNGAPVLDFDPGLIKTLVAISADDPPPDLWPQFMSLRAKPLLVIRGGISDLFSQATLDMMDRAHPTLKSVVVPDQGHVPSLLYPPALEAIFAFLKALDVAHA